MSISNNILTHQIDPVIFDQNRCEWRIDPKIWLSNWRLADLGVNMTNTTSAGTNRELNTRFVSNLGAYSLIQRVVLYNDTVQLAELRNVGRWLSFKNLQRTNANAYNVAKTLARSSFAVDVNNNTVVDNAFTGGRNYELLAVKDYTDNDNNLRPNMTAVAVRNQTPTAFLDLTQVLPILKAQPYVLGNELRSLRLVVEWAPHSTEAEIAKFVVGKKGGGAPTLEILKPTLLLDEVVDPSASSKLKNKPITYVNLDHEIVNIPSGKMSVDLRLRAFDDKYVKRVLFMNEETVIDANESEAGTGRHPSTYFGAFASYTVPGEKLQWKINGSKLLPYDGITNENQKLAMLNDVWGNFLCPQGAQYQNLLSRHLLFDKHDITDAAAVLPKITEQHNLCGQMYTGASS